MPDRSALVLGGTSGIGLGIARRLVAHGVRVTVAGRDPVRTEEVARGLRKTAPAADVRHISLDLTRPDGVAGALRQHGGDFDIAVLNGPGHRPGTLADATADDFTEAYRTMFLSLRQVVRSVLGGMRERQWGRVLYVSSTSVIAPIGELAVSSVVRAAVTSYLKLLANEVAAHGITVNSVIPGRIDTPRVREVDRVRGQSRGVGADQVRRDTEQRIPVGRYGTPEEIGELAAFLCSDQAGYLTGSAFRCDGGMTTAL